MKLFIISSIKCVVNRWIKMLKIIKSVLAAFFGVQSEANRQQDFQSVSPWKFILVGILMALILVILVASVAWLAAN